ncbi:coiled-coil domain-containing protein 73 isoform X1 [Pitangus sulphuratus]|nr:coiled-coil domain-containing protein 73 isoform X1 [Pitangus sulphuratus]
MPILDELFVCVSCAKELKKATADLIRSKVTSQYRVGEENINLAAKEKQFQELQQKIRMALERDNELQREKAKENEEKFLNLQSEHEKALRTWKKDEENMRREIDTIKNELNSLKGLHGPLEDYPPPQGNQHSEQVENLQVLSAVLPTPTKSGQEQSKDSDIQAIQKENEFIQSVIRKYDLQVLENSSKDEINVAGACEEKQREASPRNTLCTDTDLITQGQSSEIHVTGSKEAENPGATQRMVLDENNPNLEQKPQASTEPWAAGHTQRNDITEPVGADKKSGNQETNSSKEELCNATAESTWAEAGTKSDTLQHSRSVLTPEALKPEPEGVVCTERDALCERTTGDHQAKERSQTEYQKCSLLTGDNYMGSRLHQTEKTLNLSGFHKLPLKQVHADAKDRNDARNTNTNGALGSSGVPATDAQNLPTVYCDNAGKEHSDNVTVSATFSLCPPKTERGIKVGDVPSKQPEQDSTEQTNTVSATNTSTSNAETTSPGRADGLEIAPKNPPTDRAGTDKLIPCKKLNSDTQMHSIKNGHSLEINNSTNNTLLKEKKDLLTSTVPGRKFAEGHLKESCSFPMRTSGNLVNISGRSSFDLSTSDKKAEKTPLYFNFLDLSSCSRVNQMRGQATWTSAPKEPSLLKLPCLVENTKGISKTQCQNLGENADTGETGQGSTSSTRAANTLNTSNIQRDPQGEPSEEWNAIAKTFYDSSFPTEHCSTKSSDLNPLHLNFTGISTATFVFCQVKEGFTALQQKSSPMTVTPARSEKALRDEDNSALHNSILQNQIDIEKFRNLEILHSARKRKHEEGQ